MPPEVPTTDEAIQDLKCGLEIHQQLDTGKLFCRCPSTLDDDVTDEFVRYLKPTRSELGEVDPAALLEAAKGKRFRYQVSDGICLVEADEEPPHELNGDALDVALTLAAFLESDPADEVHVMRKIVIDGSNTTGFQRTCLVASGGRIEAGGDVGIQTICLEEDAARLVETTDEEVVYKLDRLGIPLIELATDPDITSPNQAREVAARIGALLRATGQVKRGLGTIRQDLNVSVPEGARVEIKGVQELDQIPEIVANEAKRQRFFARLADELAAEIDPDDVPEEVQDVSDVLQDTDSGMVQGALDRGHEVLAVVLPGFDGRLGGEPFRLGKELADHAKAAGVKGILHSDEMPGYGIGADEIAALRDRLDLDDRDAFALVLAPEEQGRAALARVVDRARQASEGVPEETRDAQPDGRSSYSRPLAGEARMYPETDVPPVRVTAGRFGGVRSDLPELPEERRTRMRSAYDLSDEVVDQLVAAGQAGRFEDLVRDGLDGILARLLLQDLPDRGLEDVDDGAIDAALRAIADDRVAGDAAPDLVEAIADGRTVDEAIDALGLETLTRDEIAAMADDLIAEREDFVAERGMGAVGPLMGPMMERVQGQADGSVVNEVLRERLEAHVDG